MPEAKEIVKITKYISQNAQVNFGVPQGTVFGLPLISIYYFII